MKYMIHACPERMWYVNDFLVPSMTAQGIDKNNVIVWNDENHDGCQLSFAYSCHSLNGSTDVTWHLQDDVAISRMFKERTFYYRTEGVVRGFCCERWDNVRNTGYVLPRDAWFSFQCIQIPDVYAVEFAYWYFNEACYDPGLKNVIAEGKDDDFLFRQFMKIRHPDKWTFNVMPALVEHVDWLLGGSVVNPKRFENSGPTRAYYWEDHEIIDKLKADLAEYKKGVSHGPDDSEHDTGSKSDAELSKSAERSDHADLRMGKQQRRGNKVSDSVQ